MLKPVWIVAFTGHRPNEEPGRSVEQLSKCGPAIRRSLKDLADRANTAGGSLELLTSVAAGSDLEAAEAAEELDIPTHIILPLPEEMFRRDFSDGLESDWARAERQIERSRDRVNRGSFRIATGDNVRPDCYHETNLQMIESADALLAVWNGESSGNVGGTDEVVEEARRLAIPQIIVDPTKAQASDVGSSETRDWPEIEEVGAWSNWPAKSETIAELDNWTSNLKGPFERADGDRWGEGEAWDTYLRLDTSANQSGRTYRRTILWSILFHFAAALLAAATAAFAPLAHDYADALHQKSKLQASSSTSLDPLDAPVSPTEESTDNHSTLEMILHAAPKATTFIEFCLVLAAWVLILKAKRNDTHHRWLHSRFAAELMHSLIMSAHHADPLCPIVIRHEPAWRHFALSAGLIAHRTIPPVKDLETAKRTYLKGRVFHQRDEYFNKLQPGAEWKKRWLQGLVFFVSSMAWIFIGIAFLLKIAASKWVETNFWGASIAVFLPVALPLIAGAIGGFIVSMDIARRAEGYRVMAERLDRMANLIPGVKTPGALRRLVYETEELLLDERIEWYAASKEASH